MKTRVRQTYQVGERVITPLGTGEILSCKTLDKPEGQIRCRVRHEDYHDHEGDTFEIDIEQIRHAQAPNPVLSN